ncbi:MAG: flavodoxin family protein [Limnochordia bacterium]|jgi:multimeric flavodoxin WrbA
MHVLLISGSRSLDGQTARAAEALLRGVEHAGGTTERVALPQLRVLRCEQCQDNGWGTCRTEGRCSTSDDFRSLVDKLMEADVCVFATPVYWGDLSESMRAFLDRLRRICTHSTVKERIRTKSAVGICIAGGGGGGAPSCAVSMERVLNTCGFAVLDMIPVRRQNQKLKLAVLELTGQWMVEQAAATEQPAG